MNLVRFNGLTPTLSRHNNVLDKLMGDFMSDEFNSRSMNNVPPANFYESDKDIRIEIAAAGLEKEDFNINIEKNLLTVSSEKEEVTSEAGNCYRNEFSFNQFSRSFRLSKSLNTDKISANYKNGVLNITIPKKEDSIDKPAREIKIS